MQIKKVGVLGCGLMGSGIAQVSAVAGYDVTVLEQEQKFLDKGFAGIEKSLAKFAEKPDKTGITPEKAKEARAHIKGTTSQNDLADCDIIIEAIIENVEVKKKTFSALDAIVNKDAIFATNDSAFETAYEFGKSLGKVPVRTSDKTGFIVNRLLVPYLLDAIRAYEEGVGSIPDIDNSMKLGCGYPMGPFTLLDFVGLDTTYYISQVMFDEFRERRFASPALLKRLVMAGWYGRKSGKGFYDYTDPNNPIALNF
jgi:3-hydroxybutyryl-CoA dehydrogenase